MCVCVFGFSHLMAAIPAPPRSDCVLVVEGEKLHLHKAILAQGSPVFQKMFFGALATDNEVIIPDIELEEFKQLIDYIYTEKIEFKSIENAWSVYYASNKYLVNDLKELCVGYVERNLTLSTLLLCYEYADLFNENILIDTCLKDIALYTKYVFATTSYHIKPSTWGAILKRRNCSDEELAVFALKWAMDECNFNDVKCTGENIWEILSETVLIDDDLTLDITKFLRMIDDDVDNASEENFKKLFKSLICKALKSSSVDDKKSEKQRNKPVIYELRDRYKINKNCRLKDNDVFSTTISVNAKIAVFGVVVSTEHRPCNAVKDVYTGSFIFEIYKEIDKSGKFLFLQKIIEPFSTLKYDKMQYVSFPSMVILEPSTNYIFDVRYKTPNEENSIEVLCHYYERYLRRYPNITINFSNEIHGSVIRGLSFYRVN